jgi:hypothetical protein
MSVIGGQFVTLPLVSHDETTFNAFLIDNGITDVALQQQADAAGDSLAFLDGLTASQLSETTYGNFQQGARLTTYGDLKTYATLQNELVQWDEHFASEGTDIGGNDFNYSNANEGDRQAVEVEHVLGELDSNAPGGVTDAESALSQLQTNGQLAEITNQQAQTLDVSDTRNWQANPQGDWADTNNLTLAQVIASPATPPAANTLSALQLALSAPDAEAVAVPASANSPLAVQKYTRTSADIAAWLLSQSATNKLDHTAIVA